MFIWPIRVYYEDTDCGGVVYYANYLKFMERARSEWLRSRGFEQDDLMERLGIVFAVQSAQLRFLRPGRFNERLYVGTSLRERGGASLTFHQQVIRAAGDAEARTLLCEPVPGSSAGAPTAAALCSGVVKVACLDSTGMRPRRIPQEIISELGSEH